MAILIFFIAHWYLSLFFQTVYLHRYCSHQMFQMNVFWRWFFYVGTFIFQGSSYLSPYAYARMHNQHHDYSDTENDTHSPVVTPNLVKMMMKTYDHYREEFEQSFFKRDQAYSHIPFSPLLERVADHWTSRITWGTLYFLFYLAFAPHWAFFLLLPIHWLMGPVHGAIVNWCGHKYGYRNYNGTDHSKNSLVWDVFLMGELFQNNHHEKPKSPNFAHRWYEIDLAWPFVWTLQKVKVFKRTQV